MAKPTIYILEDGSELSNALIQPIKRHLDVTQFESADAMISKIDSGAVPSLVVSDCHMPGMSGVEVCRAIRTRNLKLPVILISGWVDKKIALDAIQAGAVDFLEKPFTIKRWIDSIVKALEIHIEQQVQTKRLHYTSQLAQVQAEILKLYEKRIVEAENLAYNAGQTFPLDPKEAPEFIRIAHTVEKLQQQMSDLQRGLKELKDEEADIQTAMILTPTLVND